MTTGKLNSPSTLEMQWKSGSSPAEAMLQHWSTYGRQQPDLADLLKFLKKTGLARAIADVKKDLLKSDDEELLTNETESIPNTFKNDVNDFSEVDIIAEALSDVNFDELIVFSYHDLRNATKNFCDKKVEEGGCKIGEGAFGSVYKAVISDAVIAVKRLKDPVDKQFITELNVLTKYRHENLLSLLGCSLNGPTCCLVYDYMVNGSLQEKLACSGNSDPLSWMTRLSIAYGSALGINHLHTHGEIPLVHRDIKSANILLDENLVPKVGDFGLVRIGNSGNSTTMAVTENVFGTCVYMAREAFYGDVSVKLDTFSFGVVLLELLSGLPPFDTKREDRDLVTFIQNCDNILNVFDPKAGWNTEAASDLYNVAKLCLTESKKARPKISEVLDDLNRCLSYTRTED